MCNLDEKIPQQFKKPAGTRREGFSFLHVLQKKNGLQHRVINSAGKHSPHTDK